jgi:HrpA-like RNA helicase
MHKLVNRYGVQPIEQAVALVKKGVEEIPDLAGLVDVLPLYTTLPQEKQDQALGKPDWMKELETTDGYEDLLPEEQEIAVRDALYRSRRRVVISTNVAETSLTVHGILHVVDKMLGMRRLRQL